MPGSSNVTAPGSEPSSSQWTGGPSDIFAQLEIDLELNCGIMDDYEGVHLSQPFQANIAVMTDEMFLSPQLLSRTTSVMVATPPVYQSADAAPNSLQPSQISHAPVDATSTESSPSTYTAGDRTRRGRGRRKLPEEKLMKNQRRQTKPEICPYCSKGYEWKKYLKCHLRTNHLERAMEDGHLCEKDIQRTPCDYCHQTFARSDYTTRHLKNKHASIYEARKKNRRVS